MDGDSEGVSKGLVNFIEVHGLSWSENLPYSGVPGWTDGEFSVIYAGWETESLDSVIARYEMCKK